MIPSNLERDFHSFAEARFFARNFAVYFEVETLIKCSGEFYRVTVPRSRKLAKPKNFVQFAYMIDASSRDQLLSLLDFADNSQFSSTNLAWTDPESGLTWDREGLLITESIFNHHAAAGSEVMNKVNYAGIDGWRLPTLNELKTLSVGKLDMADIKFGVGLGKPKFWSSETTWDSGTEQCYFDLASMKIGHQHFVEHDSNRRTYGDGYTENALTIMVTSESHTAHSF